MTCIPSTAERPDVLVIGARCAGAATAMLLARRGLKVLAVDRQAYGSDTLSTHALLRPAVLQLARWGLLDRLAAAGPTPIRRTTFHYGDERIAVDIKAADGVDALYAPRRRTLDRLLVDAARDAGAQIRFETRVVDLLRDGDGRIAGALLCGPDGRTTAVRADLVIGADGVRSTVARRVGSPVEHEGRAAGAVIYGYWKGLEPDGSHWLFRDGLTAGLIPTDNGTVCVFAGMPQARFRAVGRQGLGAVYRSVLATVDPHLDALLTQAAPVETLRGFAGIRGFLRRAHGPGWALAGDAGYFKDPITAHGISDALRDAELLAEAAADGRPEAFARYQAQRDQLSLPVLEVTDAIARLDWDLPALKDHHARLSAAIKHETAVLAARPAPACAPAVAAE